MNGELPRRVLGMALVAAIAVAGVALAGRHDSRLDLTSGRRQTLAPTTRQVLALLPADAEIAAFLRPDGDAGRRASALLDRYAHASARVAVRVVDPAARPALARELGAGEAGAGSVRVGTRREPLARLDEPTITGALARLARTGERRAHFAIGHGERALDDAGPDGLSRWAASLAEAGIVASARPLLADAPADTGAVADGSGTDVLVVLAGPRADPSPAELAHLGEWLDDGGRLLVLLDPGERPALEAFLASRGVETGRDVVVDPSTRLWGAEATVPVVTSYARHPITDPLAGASVVPTFFPLARSVRPIDSPAGYRARAIASTGPHAWAETDPRTLAAGGAPSPGPDEPTGAVPLVVAVTGGPGDEPRLVVVGDADFATNGNIDLSGNGTLAVAACEWLLAGGGTPVVTAAAGAGRPVLPTVGEYRLRVLAPAFGLPALALLLGTVAALGRRRP